MKVILMQFRLMKGARTEKETTANVEKDEVDEDLDEMSYRIKDLKAIATAFSQEIDRQDPQLDELNKQMHKNETELRANMWTLRKL